MGGKNAFLRLFADHFKKLSAIGGRRPSEEVEVKASSMRIRLWEVPFYLNIREDYTFAFKAAGFVAGAFLRFRDDVIYPVAEFHFCRRCRHGQAELEHQLGKAESTHKNRFAAVVGAGQYVTRN